MSAPSRRGRFAATAAAVVLAIAGVVAIVIAVRAQQSAPQPPRSAARYVNVIPHTSGRPPISPAGRQSASARASATRHDQRTTKSTGRSRSRPQPASTGARIRGPVLPRSRPVALRVPAIGVNSRLQKLGLNRDGTVQVPPLSKNSHAGWYENSPTPGQVGPSLILGHIDSAAYGPGVFFKLGDMRQRDKVFVTRADGTIAVFEVERVVEYAKSHFPTLQVYGNTDHAALRLITCGGTFDFSQKSYEDNIVVYASLVSSHHVKGRSS